MGSQLSEMDILQYILRLLLVIFLADYTFILQTF